MAIIPSDLQFRLSGGAANSDPNASLGGAISSTALVDASLHNLFDQVNSSEASAGDVEYRCIYVRNNHATLALQNAEVYLSADAANANVTIAFGIGTSAIDGTEQTVADESTAPTGVTWEEDAGEVNALAIGDLPAQSHQAIWVRRTVTAGAAADDLDSASLVLAGDTAE